MKFLKLTVENFKPYLDKQDMVLYTKSPDKPITINVGPNEHGKTSALEAVLWTIYGTNMFPNWKDWVNWVAKEIEKQREGIVPFSTQLEVQLDDGITYQILRKAKYNITNDSQGIDELIVVQGGTPIKDGEEWIKNNFPPQNIAKYYQFSAEDMLSEFEAEHNIAVKNHINVITGITNLYALEDDFKKIIEELDSQKDTIRHQMANFDSGTHSRLRTDDKTKVEAIRRTKEEIEGLEVEKQKLFPQTPNQKEKEIVAKFNTWDKLEVEKTELDKTFETEQLAKKTQFIFLSEIITNCVQITENLPISKEQFDAATKIIQQALGTAYSGITTEGEINLLDRAAYSKLKSNLKDPNTLTLPSGSGSSSKIDDLALFQDYNQKANTDIDSISKLVASFDKAVSGQRSVKQDLTQLGATEQRGIVEKLNAWQKYVNEITDKKTLIATTERELLVTQQEIREMEEDRGTDEKSAAAIADIDLKIGNINSVLDVWKKTDRAYSRELIDKVTAKATELFLKIVKNKPLKYKGIKITDNYEIEILNINGEVIDKNKQLNKGTLEQAFFCFLLSLPMYATSTQIPLFLDNPLMRLDAGNKKRLVEALASIGSQVIMNLIPGTEYIQDQYDRWLKQYVNTQNWCKKTEDTKYGTEFSINSVQQYDPKKAIDYDEADM